MTKENKRLTEQQVASHIDWFFNASAPLMGISSSYGSFKNRMEGNQPNAYRPEYNVKTSSAVSRYNKIHNILLKLSSQQRAILSATYDHEVILPPVLRVYFDRYAAAACFTLPNIRDLMDIFTNKIQLNQEQKSFLIELKAKSKLLYRDAHITYINYWEKEYK